VPIVFLEIFEKFEMPDILEPDLDLGGGTGNWSSFIVDFLRGYF